MVDKTQASSPAGCRVGVLAFAWIEISLNFSFPLVR